MRTTALLVLVACSSPTAIDGGSAGAGGGAAGGRAGGAGGSSGGAQAGGAGGGGGSGGGGASACRGPMDLIETCVFAPDGGIATDDFTASVAVAEVTDVAGGRCDALDSSLNVGTAKRIVLDGGWEVIFRAPQLPAAFVTVGETLELALTSEFLAGSPPAISQTFTLSRDAGLVAFGAVRSSSRLAELPDFSAHGLTITDAGTVCSVIAAGCRFQDHHVRVSAGAASAVIMPPGTANVGPWAVTVEDAHDAIAFGICDQKAHVSMAGVR